MTSQSLYDPEQEPGSMEEKEFAEGFKGTELNKPGVWLRFFHVTSPILLPTCPSASALVNTNLGTILLHVALA